MIEAGEYIVVCLEDEFHEFYPWFLPEEGFRTISLSLLGLLKVSTCVSLFTCIQYNGCVTRNIINICHQSLKSKQGSSLVSPRKLGNCLSWGWIPRVLPLISAWGRIQEDISDSLGITHLSHELRGVLVIPVTGSGDLGLYNYWGWLPYLSFRLWLLDISRSDLRSFRKGISTVLCWWRWRDDMKFLGFQVQIVVRYHGHHITNTWCRPNTRIPIGYLLGLFCGFLDAGFGVGTIILTLSAIPLSELLTWVCCVG